MLTKATFSMIDSAPFSVADYGAVGDGATDNTAAIQAAIDAMSTGDMLYFPEGEWAFDRVTFDVQCGKIAGPGIIMGTINLFYNGSARMLLDGLTFRPSPISATARGILIEKLTIASITNCSFEGLETAIAVLTTEATGQVSRVTVSNCLYGDNAGNACNYFIATEPVTGETFGVADWIISDNSGNALTDHIFLNTFDGVTIHDNIFFGAARNCVRLVYGTWSNVHDNKFFECGETALLVNQMANLHAHDNVYAWVGNLVETPALQLTGTPTPGGSGFSNAIIHDEIIIEPSGSGIAIDGVNQQLFKVHDNYIYSPGANSRYVGPIPLSGATIGIDIDSGCIFAVTNNNFVVNGTNDLPQGGSGQTNTHQNNITIVSGEVVNQTIDKTLTLSGTETSVDVARWDYVNFTQSGATNVTAITNPEGVKTVSMRFFNSNTTLVHSVNLQLRAASNVTPGNGAVITFIVDTTTAVEISRNF